jgi:uncharacterized protein (TIGR03437 family)
VRIGGEDAPLYYVGPGQINAQVPFGARPGENVSVVVNSNGRLTAPQNFLIAPAEPGIFKAGNSAAVLDAQTYQQITPSNPTHLGSAVLIFANGLGLTNRWQQREPIRRRRAQWRIQ